jgi:hypothetical protein
VVYKEELGKVGGKREETKTKRKRKGGLRIEKVRRKM